MPDRTHRPSPRHAPSRGTRSETPPVRADSAPAPRRPAPRGGTAAPTEAARGTAPHGREWSRPGAGPATGAL